MTNVLVVTKTELNAIFNDMGKTTPASRCINCSCCGYDTCEQMAKAIHNGFNYKENCIHFVKDQVEIEKEHALKLAQEVEEEKDVISKQQDKIITTVILADIDAIQKSAELLKDTIEDVNLRTESLAAVTEEISSSSDTILASSADVKNSLEALTE